MLKSESVLEVKKGERVYGLHCDSQSPLGELFDALCEMQVYVVGKIKESQTQAPAAVEPTEVLPQEV